MRAGGSPRPSSRCRCEGRDRRRDRRLRAGARKAAQGAGRGGLRRLARRAARKGARDRARGRGRHERGRRPGRRPRRPRDEVERCPRHGARPRRRDRRHAGPLRRERPRLHRRGRAPGSRGALTSGGGRRDRARAGRVRLAVAVGGAPGRGRLARRGRPRLRRPRRDEAPRARPGRPARRRPRDRRRAARELARARGDDRRDLEREPRARRGRGPAHHRPSVISVHPVEGLPEIREGDDLGALIAERAELLDGHVLVVAQKVVSKAEGRVVRLDEVEPSDEARALAGGEDPRRLEVILRESARLVRTRPPLVIAETWHGFVCASAGVDSSNAPEAGTVVLLPEDPDASAARLRERLRELTGAEIGVIVSDSFGRAWRQGTTDVAIGLAGIRALLDLTGERDAAGYELHATVIAVADELAAAAQLAMGKTSGIPAAVIRGYDASGEGSARDLVMPAERDLFR